MNKLHVRQNKKKIIMRQAQKFPDMLISILRENHISILKKKIRKIYQKS